MSRERLLILYALAVAAGGWLWLLATPAGGAPLTALVLFGALALATDTLSFRLPPADSCSLAGIVLLAAALALGPAAAALVAAVEGALAGLLLALIYQQPRGFYQLAARPLMRGGVRAAGLLLGAALAGIASGRPQLDPAELDPATLLLWSALGLTGLVQLSRIGREALQGGLSGVRAWWRASWRLSLWAELAPLPMALLAAAIYSQLGNDYFLLAGIGLVAAAAAVRRATLNLASQRRSVRELALLNEASRAIIRSELNVETLCEVVYREAGKIVDTSSFHLGLFDGDSYSLVVRVQDRVRLPRLTVDLAGGDGLIGWMRQTGKALLVEDFTREMERLPARPRYQSAHPPRSGIYVPLIAGDHVIGSISVQSYQPSAFGASDLRLLSLIADQAAVAITRARAFREASTRAVQLQAIHQVSERITAILDLDQLLPAVVRLIHEHFSYQPVHIFTLEPGDGRIRFRASTATGKQLDELMEIRLSLGQGIVGGAAQGSEPILVDDVRREPRYLRDSQATRSELAVPLIVGAQVLGVLDVQSETVADFNADDLFVMRTLADQIAIAIDGANTYRAQQEEAWTLNALLQVAENIGRAASVEELLATAARLPPLLIGPSRCYVLLWDHERAQFSVRAVYGLGLAARVRLLGYAEGPATAPLLARLHAAAAPEGPRLLTFTGARELATAWPSLPAPAAQGGLVAMPLIGRAGLLGALILDYDQDEPQLDARQTSLCVSAARQLAAALESLLLAREAELAARLEQELRVAREIQTALLPAAPPRLPGWQIDAAWRSARLVGGDFFDFWPLEIRGQGSGVRGQGSEDTGNREPGTAGRAPEVGPATPSALSLQPSALSPLPSALGFVIADVSDKGVPAAMFMAMSRSLVRAAALDGSPPPRALERANRWISRDSESGMFVTLFYGVLDPLSGQLRYCVAGHNPPLHFRAADASLHELRTPGIALGVLDEVTLHEAETTLAPGDLLVCYTDGVTEAIDEENAEFGVERLRGLIRSLRQASASALMQAILADLELHSRGQPPFDDVTLVVIKREEG